MEFSEQLTQNVKQATVAALIATVIEDDSRTIGEILDSLENDKDADFLTQTFKELTIAKLLEAAVHLNEMKHAAETAAQEDIGDAEFSVRQGDDEDEQEEGVAEGEDKEDEEGEENEEGDEEDEEEDDFEDEEDLADDDDLSDLEDEEESEEEDEDEEEVRAPRKRPRVNGKDTSGKLPLHDPEVQKEYQSNIVKFLRKNKDPKGTPAAIVRESVGGTPTQVRENLNELIEAGRVSFTGKARGTRYHLTD